MQVSGFTVLRDADRLGYPFVESIRSLLPMVDELVVALGDCTDETEEILRRIESPKIRIVHSVWDPTLLAGGKVLAEETNKALTECRGDWCFYLQADEVLHEGDYDAIRAAMQKHLPNERVEGLSFRYHHFRGDYDIRDPLTYRRQVRIVRNGCGVRSVGDACGFGVTDAAGKRRKLRCRSTGAWVYHYGWVRPPRVMNQKREEFTHFYHGHENRGLAQAEREVEQDYIYNVSRCELFRGTHPAVMEARINQKDWDVPFEPVQWWRNKAWWDGFAKKNFKTIYRRVA